MKKLILIVILSLIPIHSAHADHITIVNNSKYKINEPKMLNLAHKYRSLVLKHWKVPEYPITIYFGDDWLDGARAHVNKHYIAYHWYTDTHPIIYINMSQVRYYGMRLSVVLTHELAEATVNPFVDKYVIHENRRVYIEICDPTNTTFNIGIYRVADFALPSFYDIKAKGPYSYERSLQKPFESLTGFWYKP